MATEIKIKIKYDDTQIIPRQTADTQKAAAKEREKSNIFGNKIQAKLPIAKDQNKAVTPEVKVGDRIQIIVTYLGSSKIIIERA